MTNTINLYVANLGKYNEGFLVGEWFDLQEVTDIEEIKSAIGINDRYEEMAIHDYEAPFSIGEYDNIGELMEIASRMAELDEIEILAASELIENGIVSNFEEALEKLEDVRFYHNCKDMEDVAYEVVEECGYLDQMPENLRFYFDYEKFGRDLEIEGTFFYLGNEVYIEVIG